MRHKAKHMWLAGEFNVLSEFSREKDAGCSESGSGVQSSFDELKTRYNLTGNESYNLVEAGLDSLDLVVFMHELKELLKDKGRRHAGAAGRYRCHSAGSAWLISFDSRNSWNVRLRKRSFSCVIPWQPSVMGSGQRKRR